MRSRKLTALLLTSALCATALFGCSSDDSKETTKGGDNTPATTVDPANEEAKELTLKVWAPAEDQSEESGKWLQTQCEKFNEEHPNWKLTFTYETCSEGDAGKTVAQDPKAAADVYMYANDQLKTLVDAQGIAPFAGAAETYVKETNSETIVNSVTYDGLVYGIPYTSNIWFMYYDNTVFTEDDVKNLDDMLAKGKVSFPIENAWYTQAFFLAAGCTMGPDSDPKLDFSGENGLAATNYMIDLYANPNFIATDDSGKGISALGSGDASAAFSGSWDLKNAQDALGDKLGIAAIPKCGTATGDGQMRALAGSKAVGVNPNTADMEVAVALAKFLTSEEAQKAHYELRGIVPCNTNLQQDEKVSNDAVFIAQNQSFDNGSILQQSYLTGDNWWTPAADFAKAIGSGDIKKDNAQEQVDKFSEQCSSNVK